MTGFQKCIKVGAIIFGTYLSTIVIGIIVVITLSIIWGFVALSSDDWILEEKHYEEYRDDDYYEDIMYKGLEDKYYKDFTNQL